MVTETRKAGEFLISEGNGNISREEITVLSGEDLVAGTVLGKVTNAGATAAAAAGNTGDGAMGAITVSTGAKAGVYKLTFIEPGTNVGTFIVEDPDGINVGTGVVATAFSGGGLAFTLADGAADFISGDSLDITVAAGSGKYVAYDDTATDGSEVAAGILYADCDATSGDTIATAVVRDAEVSSALLTGSDAAGVIDLAAINIIVR